MSHETSTHSGPARSRDLPRIAITVGDAAGVGPELALKCAAEATVVQRCQPILVGPEAPIRQVAAKLRLAVPPTITLGDLESPGAQEGPLSLGPLLLACGDVPLDGFQPGTFSAATGRASFEAVELAIEGTMGGLFDGIVTGPIQKEAWHAAGTGYLGHTELLADRTETSDFCMMLSGEACSTVLATIHLPLADAIKTLSGEQIKRAIRQGATAMEKRYGRPPRVTVLGLNPHAGEGGLLSHGEEENIIQPAIESVRRWAHSQDKDWTITGPVPPDTAFTPAMRAATDVHVCMYHDQGLIPLKALSFDDAVNVTLGLPIVRTSVDHGTAMDLAWKGDAKTGSMLAAITMAIDLCE
ncbi:4-hydroxythreonine-4-phosphate dehydrogenase PdxA [Rhodopirellula sp. MGV]|uniref:4-hydroxythreonine-4-phosphate dehydrogenase PdxA n=1 Tax=Rhodopirellula sp. MGV TaxID=2023130 RepID=UPI000B978BDF|nr:4-hydroxythreonine-4-phosphate dehydrogenase PdxA [Rhodopirellula sp. MGV]OYP36363.1 4-hydroxythreonine-4-phosphate dehydrogenase PdxA [Rhodopirellula sp. MGV]PNY38405.1 4-hydroxythreonine-4-phosphate dehydrogenase PdxA [Rhodopirellula baltica]